MLDGINAALESGDVATEQILTDFLMHMEKRNWMFTSYLK
jgi:starvation-inducible DNA-binding protein